MTRIRTLGDPILQQRCAPVDPTNSELEQQIQTCHDALARFRAEHGYGPPCG